MHARPRGSRRQGRFGAMVLLCSAGAASVCGSLLAGPVRIVEAVAFRLDVRPMLVVDGEAGGLPNRGFEIPPGEQGRLRMELPWPDSGRSGVLVLIGKGQSDDPDGELRLELEAVLTLPDGRSVRANRTLIQREGAVGLFEVYRDPSVRVTLGVSAERQIRHVAHRIEAVGDRVLFRLDVDAIRGERVYELESNRMNTFVGEPVAYSFRRGEAELAESVRIELTPLSKTGELVEVLVEISGSLPGQPSRLVLSRRETLVTSRGATSSVAVTTGSPPAGYRFRISPEF